MFEYNGEMFAIVQSNQCNADICLAKWNSDFTVLTFYKQPLVTNKSIKGVGIYKPTAVELGDKLYVYVSAQKRDARGKNLLFQGCVDLNPIINS